MKKYTISLTNFQLDRLRGPKGRVLLETVSIYSLTNLQLDRLRGPKGRVLLVTISIYSLTNFQSNRLRGPRADVPDVGQGRVLLEKYVPLLLIKLTYLHIQIRHVHLQFRNNIVLLVSFCLRNWTTLLSV